MDDDGARRDDAEPPGREDDQGRPGRTRARGRKRGWLFAGFSLIAELFDSLPWP